MITIICTLGYEVLAFEAIADKDVEKARTYYVNNCGAMWGLKPANIEFRYWRSFKNKRRKTVILPNRI